jgi:hypothetical protein
MVLAAEDRWPVPDSIILWRRHRYPGAESSALNGLLSLGNVSAMRIATITPENKVRPAFGAD